MSFTLATWNINSVRLRIDDVARFVEQEKPDVLCLQEIKCSLDNFPSKAFTKMGYDFQAVNGQKGYHGVAIVSRYALRDVDTREFCAMGDARHIAASLADGPASGLRVHNFYIPAGGDEPDPEINPKFAHKLKFLDELEAWELLHHADLAKRTVLVGDLNIAPLEHDVWSSKQLKNVVSHTDLERKRLTEVLKAGNWVDAMRQVIPPEQKLYTWWSYRSPDWDKADKGRRLDHVWVSPSLKDKVAGITVHRECRGWERPSDHAPVLTQFTF